MRSLISMMIVAFVASVLLGAPPTSSARDVSPPPSIATLRSEHFDATLKQEGPTTGGPDFTAYLVSYRSSGLKVYAMVAVPRTPAPRLGFPVLIADHGFVPHPREYGFTAAGVNSRPGDYYRPIPELYTKNGFIVVMPDYRGHNTSEGFEYTKGFFASDYYTEDVLNLLSGLHEIAHADMQNVFAWGHSMGGEVTLRLLLATKLIKGASLWDSVGGTVWDQALYYSRYTDLLAPDSSAIEKHDISSLRADIKSFGPHFDWQAREPLLHLQYLHTPLIIHHSIADKGAEYAWSQRLVAALCSDNLPYEFYTYPGNNHFLQGSLRDLAVARDVNFFRSLMAKESAETVK